jgi:uncharacterized repeat protein (TIGR01451 family)
LRGVNAFFSFFDSYNSISEVPADTLNAVPLDSKIKSAGWGPKKVFLSGTIVRDEGADTYYLLMNKTLYPFASVDVVNSFGLKAKSAQDVDQLFIKIYSIGHTLNALSDLPSATVFSYPNSSRLYVLDIDTDGKMSKKYIAVYSLFSRNYATNQIVRFPVSYSVPYAAQKSISTSKVIKSIIQSSVDTNPPQKESNSGSGVENGSGQTSNKGQDSSEKPSSPTTGNTGSNGQTQTSSSTPSAATSSINSVFPKTTAPIGGGSSRNDNGGPQPTVSAGTTNLSLMVTAGSSSVTPSTSVLFTIEYRNLGTGTATGVVIQEIVPTSTFFSVNGSTGSWDCADRSATGTVCLATIGSVAPGATSSIIFAITPSSSFETI